jgi:hypothetical protein
MRNNYLLKYIYISIYKYMRLTTVIASTNSNPNYYLFIPKQIKFWSHFNINFIGIYVGESIPIELEAYSKNIILYNRNLNINSAFVAQNIRIYYPSLLNLSDDELVMITDMDMLPMNDTYYKMGLENFSQEDFIYYRHIDQNQIYMCYNAAHPKTWSKIFGINTLKDIETQIDKSYNKMYTGIPGGTGWFSDQEIMYKKLISYPNLKVLNRSIKRLEVNMYLKHLQIGHNNFISSYDDAHFHRSYTKNKMIIQHAENQLL